MAVRCGFQIWQYNVRPLRLKEGNHSSYLIFNGKSSSGISGRILVNAVNHTAHAEKNIADPFPTHLQMLPKKIAEM